MVALVANSRAASTVMPAMAAQLSASTRLTEGSAGSVGGTLPVVRVHAIVTALRARYMAIAVASTGNTRPPEPPPFCLVIRYLLVPLGGAAPSSHGLAAAFDRGRKLLRVPGGNQPVRHLATRIGQRDVYGALQIRSQHEAGSRVRSWAAQQRGLLLVERDDLADLAQRQRGATGPQRSIRDFDARRAPRQQEPGHGSDEHRVDQRRNEPPEAGINFATEDSYDRDGEQPPADGHPQVLAVRTHAVNRSWLDGPMMGRAARRMANGVAGRRTADSRAGEAAGAAENGAAPGGPPDTARPPAALSEAARQGRAPGPEVPR